jgi:hypothetical protein
MFNLLLLLFIGLSGSIILSVVSMTSTFAELSISNKNSQNCRKISGEVGTWLYFSEFNKIDKKIIKGLKEKNFNTLYLSLKFKDGDYLFGNDIKNFIASAKKQGFKIYAVILQDPVFIFANRTELRSSFGNIVKDSRHVFDGYIVDVEPHTKDKANPQLYLMRYLSMSKLIHKIADHYNVNYFDTVPIWYHEEMKKIGIKDGLSSLFSDRLYLLDYESSVDEIMNKYSAIRDELNKCTIVNIKLTPGFDEPNLNPSEISNAINSIKKTGAGIGIFEAFYSLTLNSTFFQLPEPER